MKSKIIPASVFNRLSYDKKTGDIKWKYFNKHHPRLNGKGAGCESSGYLVIKIDGIPYKAHRIAWFLANNTQPEFIDHINGNTLDNRLANLREASHAENMRNHGKSLSKKPIPCGVRLLSSGKFQARITFNKKQITVGTFSNVDLAKKAYLSKRKELFKEFSRGE
jgi:hypothetical protein